MPSEMVGYSKKRCVKMLHKMLDFWVPMLRLEQWNISVRVARNLDGFAHLEANSNHLTARITIRHPDSTPKDTSACTSPEVTLVHELVHLLAIPDGKLPESSVEVLALALVASRLGKSSKELQSNGNLW